MKFRKKPVVIEAFRLLSLANHYPDWFMDRVKDGTISLHSEDERDRFAPISASIETLEGVMTANSGDMVIRGVKGEIYPCKPDIFAATYEPVEPAQAVDAGATPLAVGATESA